MNQNTESNFGLVINWQFHAENRWVAATTKYLINAINETFRPLIIESQEAYEKNKDQLDYLISVEPGWAAPQLDYDTSLKTKKAVFYSDPHYETERRWRFLDENGFDFVFSYYKSPFFHHFRGFDTKRFVHMPWAVPDSLVAVNEIKSRNNTVAIFGSSQSDAYDVRNWCRAQAGVESFNYGGVENKVHTDEAYFDWLAQFDALIAAGSSNPDYDLVTPKYFEIMSSGALLVGQFCHDFYDLGFDRSNCVVFTKADFLEKLNQYKNNPESYLAIRKAGRKLISEKHLISHRIAKIKSVFELA